MGFKDREGKARFVVALCAFVLGVCPTAAVAATGNHGGGGSSNDPGTSGKHGQDCAPGYHDTGNGSCEHNGGGGGNCGDNQSGNDNGLGNNGNDNGFGHNGDQCDPSSPPSGPPSTPGPPSHPSPPATPNGPTTPAASASDPPARDSNACAASLTLGRTRFIVGRRALLTVRVRDEHRAPLRGVTVLVHGAGVRLTAATGSLGKVRFTVRPRSAGVIRIALVQPAACASISRLARVTGVFKPPKPNYTG